MCKTKSLDQAWQQKMASPSRIGHRGVDCTNLFSLKRPCPKSLPYKTTFNKLVPALFCSVCKVAWTCPQFCEWAFRQPNFWSSGHQMSVAITMILEWKTCLLASCYSTLNYWESCILFTRLCTDILKPKTSENHLLFCSWWCKRQGCGGNKMYDQYR